MDTVELRPDRPEIVVHPATGEVLHLTGETADLVRWLQEVRDMESQIRDVKRLVTRELIARMDRDVRYTLQIGDLDVKGDGPIPPTVYDGQQLRQALTEYVDADVITQDTLDRAVEVTQEYRPRAAGINALKRLGGGVALTIEQHGRPKENYERRISIKSNRAARKAVST